MLKPVMKLKKALEYWKSCEIYGVPKAHMVARSVELPVDFPFRDISAPGGWTTAHEAAKNDTLPKGFNQWELADINGWTVAHVAAMEGTLPKDFDKWELASRTGWSVALTAAIHGTLPLDFKRFELLGDSIERYPRTSMRKIRRYVKPYSWEDWSHDSFIKFPWNTSLITIF
ncbi:MAG: hypothetical protein LBR53_08020 [Deltaproteobacteria bacterium]|nr:hypothetical protein [Deltaproteobacteria bacterium]